MRSNRPSGVMPAQRHPAALRGGDPLFAGIHVFLARFQLERHGWPGTSPAMTPSKRFNMTGTRYSANPGFVERFTDRQGRRSDGCPFDRKSRRNASWIKLFM